MRELIRGLKGTHTVLVSSHILPEISETCDRLLIIHGGQLVAQGTEDELARKLGGGSIEVEVRGDKAKALEALAGIGAVTRGAGRTARCCRLRVEASPDLRPRVAQALVGAGLELLRLDRGHGAAGVHLPAADAAGGHGPGGGIVKALLIARRELAGYLRTLSGYIIIAVDPRVERAVLQRVRPGQGGRALRDGAVQLLLLLERLHHRRLGVHLHAAAGRGAAGGHAAAAVLLAAEGPGHRAGQVPGGAGLPGAVPGVHDLHAAADRW